MKRKTKTQGFVPPKGSGPFKLNQRADVFEHKATKRNRTRSAQKKNALNDSSSVKA